MTDTNLIIKTTDGEVKAYAEVNFHIEHNGVVTVIKADTTVDTYHMSNIYYIREEKINV